jgi:F420-dependent methylenetetrahydromethanopterin dehydrogenase
MGSKMSPEDVEETLPKIFDFDPDMVLAVSPNAAAPGPCRMIYQEADRMICAIKMGGHLSRRGW